MNKDMDLINSISELASKNIIEYIIETYGDPDLDENSDYYGFNNIEFKYN